MRLAMLAFAVLALTLALGAASAQALQVPVGSFGSQGSGAGQFQTPVGVAVDQANGNVYVADSGNARVEKFDAKGNFIAAFGWGVSDGAAHSEVCTSSCQAGICGSGAGQFSRPTSIAVDSSGGPSAGDVYVGDAGNNVVEKFDSSGNFLSANNGSSAPQGGFSALVGIAVDQSGNLWTADANTDNITEFDNTGAFLQQWTDPFGTTLAITVDSVHGKVYLIRGVQTTESFTLTGGNETAVDNEGSGVALALDPQTGNLYVDHSDHVNVWNTSGTQLDSFSLVSSNSQGLAFGSTAGDLYISDATADNVTLYAPPPPGPPFVTGESVTNIHQISIHQDGATLNATVVPAGFDTTCTFQFVDDATFKASGYSNATTAPCTPADLGSSFTNQSASADVTGLKPGTTYHFRAVATNSAGTTNGVDKTFQTLPVTLLSFVGTFGTQGSGAGQFQAPLGVAVAPSSGDVYVADSANARVEQFDATGHFIAAFGWGVSDGKAQSEVCTSNCQAGIPGSGAGQFSDPTSVAASNGRLFVGDSGNNAVETFDADGGFLSAIDGSSTPQGKFQFLAGVAVDQSGNMWTADGGSDNIDEFTSKGAFVRQWTDTAGSPRAIAVDSTNGKVYLVTFGETDSWTLTGQNKTKIDPGGGTALALDPRTGNLYVDHGGDVAVYDHTGIHVDTFPLGSTTNSQGLAYAALTGGLLKPGQGDLYVSDASNNNVTMLGPPTTPGPPLITNESATQTGKTTATLTAGIVPLGLATTCTFQFVSDASFQASGYTNATSVPCTPASLGSGFTYQGASANLTGLTPNTTYHFRVVGTNSAGTTTGADQTFQEVFAWAPFTRCPVDDPAMLATDGGVTTLAVCLASNSTHGSIKIGNITTATGNTNLQAGLIFNESTDVFTFVSPPAGALVADPVQLSTPIGPVTATAESAGNPSNFNFIAGIELNVPILTLPIKIHLENPVLGPSCFIGSNQNPIVLQPANTDLSNAKLNAFAFDPNGVPDPNGPLETIAVTGAVQGDNTFAVPGATGCGTNDSLDAAVNAVAGLPSPSGNNDIVLDDASSNLAFEPGVSGQQFANAWHTGFGS